MTDADHEFLDACRDAGLPLPASVRSAWDLATTEGALNADSIPGVLELLTNRNALIRRAAAWIAGHMGDLSRGRIVEQLEAMLTDPVRAVAREAIHALGVLGVVAKPALGRLTQVVASQVETDADTASMALRSIGLIGHGDDDTIDSLLPALTIDDWKIRKWAAWALGEITSPARAKAVIGALEQLSETDSSPDVRDAARSALHELSSF